MDPDEVLKQIRAMCERVLDGHETGADHTECALLLAMLAGDMRELDAWIVRGGFLPLSWGKHWREARS